jgi:hypothetical protein
MAGNTRTEKTTKERALSTNALAQRFPLSPDRPAKSCRRAGTAFSFRALAVKYELLPRGICGRLPTFRRMLQIEKRKLWPRCRRRCGVKSSE